MPVELNTHGGSGVRSPYFVYVATNPERNVFYTGVTRDLKADFPDAVSETPGFNPESQRLIYLERFDQLRSALQRENEIKNLNGYRKQEILDGSVSIWTLLA